VVLGSKKRKEKSDLTGQKGRGNSRAKKKTNPETNCTPGKTSSYRKKTYSQMAIEVQKKKDLTRISKANRKDT